ncbi:MAG: hypothetical protein RLZZ38_1051 [Bacteroidota bacterium]|jgi:hypothetical protein
MNAFSTRPIPVLKGKVAQDFLREAEAAQKKQGSIDMSKKRAAYLEILKTAKLG